MIIRENLNSGGENSSTKQPEITENSQKDENLFSPRFRSIAAMAGWDEESLFLSFIVEDTPDRQSKHKRKSSSQNLKTSSSNSRRKCKTPRRSPVSIPVVVLDLDEDLDASTAKQGGEETKTEANASAEVEKKSTNASAEVEKKSTNVTPEVEKSTSECKVKAKNAALSSSPSIPCIDKLREELSCAICLEICYEPSTTPCGHSFCKQCLRSAADKCGKRCPKCRQLISNGRYCTVNTVLWNTIQLLFPQEVEARKSAAASVAAPEPQKGSSSSRDRHHHHHHNGRNRSIQALNCPESGPTTGLERRNNRNRTRISSRPSEMLSRQRDISTRIELAIQDSDTSLALRLQREEFMQTLRVPDERRNAVSMARANLRVMASRATGVRIRDRAR